MARASADIFRTGEVLSHTYEIEANLGGGGVGQVYRARNVVSDSVVAIKVLNEDVSRNADYMELIKREERMREISHDAVVNYYVLSRTEDGHIYLVMEYVEGPSLDLLMQRRGVPADQLLVLARRIAEGLAATHARGLVHRDLSPDNVILRGGRPEQAVIIDFGIAKDTRPGARTVIGSDFAGKYEYAAPEQFEGKADARSDLYALGASLLAAWQGETPRMPGAVAEIIRRKARPLDTEGVPQPLRGVIDWLTQPDPARRPDSAEALIRRLDEISAGGGGGRRWWLAVPVALVAAAAVAVALFRGDIERLVSPPPPVVSPYVLTAERAADGSGGADGFAPDAESRDRIAGYLASDARLPEDAVDLRLGSGVPSAHWAEDVTALLDATAPLDEWRVEVIDRSATLTGLAADRTARQQAAEAFRAAAAAGGYDPTLRIEIGPRQLDPEAVRAALAETGTCGPLQLVDPPLSYGLGAEIAVAGAVADAEERTKIESRLARLAGDRPLHLDLAVLNRAVCRIRDILPDGVRSDISFWFGQGKGGEANFSGVYAVGENPVVDVLIPATVTEGYLYVAAVDVSGVVFHMLPHVGRQENRVSEIGEVTQGVRRVRVAYPADERLEDANKIAFLITPDFGKTMFLALLSPKPLFDGLRPSQESVESFAEALAASQDSPDMAVRSFASRLLETRQ